MENINKIESKILEWLKPVPHLPADWRKWLGDNVWWIVIIGIVLSIIAGLASLSLVMGGAAILGGLGAVTGYGAVVALSVFAVAETLVSLGFIVIQVLIMIAAVKPLREKKENGWKLLFKSFLVGVVASAVNIILSFAVGFGDFVASLFAAAIGTAIMAYLTFEIRGEFVKSKEAAKSGVKSEKSSKDSKEESK